MKKITVPKIALLVASPTTVACAALFSSCSSVDEITTQTHILNANESGLASLEVTFNEQPLYNQAIVSVENKSTQEVRVVSKVNDEVNYVNVIGKTAIVSVEFVSMPLEDTESTFTLWFSYIKQNGQAVSVPINNLTLKMKTDPSCLSDELHILSINDFHGAAPGFGDKKMSAGIKDPGALRVMKEAESVLKKYPGSIFLSAGDNNSGTAFSASTHGETLFPVLSSMGIRYSAVGNHAFEWGLDYLSAEKFDDWGRTRETSGKYFIAANILSNPNYKDKKWIYDKTDPGYNDDFLIWNNQCVRWADPYKIVNMKGHKFCLIGLTTQQTYNDGNQDVAKHLSFIDYNAAVHYAKDKCRLDLGQTLYSEIESFILLTHVESDQDTTTGEPILAAADLGKTITTDIDAIISGHSHKTVCGKVHNDNLHKDIWIGQASTAGRQILDIKMVLDNTQYVGKRIKEMKMSIHKVPIDLGGIDPETKDPTEKQKAKEAATREYDALLEHAPSESIARLGRVLNEKENIVQSKFKEVLATSEAGADYTLPPGKEIGHEYIEFDKFAAQMGCWHNKAELLGFANLFCKGSEPAVSLKPSLSFINQDSIRHSWTAGHVVTLGDLFQLQTYENTTWYGYLSINQVANIIDYMIADGSKQFIYPPENAGKYTGRLDTDYLGNRCVEDDVTLEPSKTATTKDVSAYLCGPLQWYGMRFEVEAKKEVTGYDWDRKWQLKYVTEQIEIESGVFKNITYPCIWFYDPQISSTTLDDPTTWISAREYKINEEKQKFTKFFGVTINSFTYGGQNFANRMFKHYFNYNYKLQPSLKPVMFSQITRELLIEFARNWSTLATKFDVTQDDLDKMVTFPQ